MPAQPGKKVYISPDLAPKEREQGKILRDELKKCKNAGEKNLYIKFVKTMIRNLQSPNGASKPPTETTTDTSA